MIVQSRVTLLMRTNAYAVGSLAPGSPYHFLARRKNLEKRSRGKGRERAGGRYWGVGEG